jgi:hypothetical protein
VALRTLPRSSRPWITLTTFLPPHLIDIIIPPPFVRLLLSARTLSTSTTTRLITRKCTESPWVCHIIFIHVLPSPLSLAVLHPRHKLAYFKAQGWEEGWINTAYNIVREEYDRSYAASRFDSDSDEDYIAVGSVDSVSVLFFSCALQFTPSTVDFVLK